MREYRLMTPAEISDLMTQRMVTTVTVQSYRGGMTVMVPPADNYRYGRARGNVRDAVRRRVTDVATEYGWSGEDYDIGPVSPTVRRGEYRVTVWRDK